MCSLCAAGRSCGSRGGRRRRIGLVNTWVTILAVVHVARLVDRRRIVSGVRIVGRSLRRLLDRHVSASRFLTRRALDVALRLTNGSVGR
ncbi:MAG TPA: hypothetical protein VES67_07330 [Vicinamibacterales bacterium]|nr:hypothetical protein [Vicinamibacterales bacterium]